jgi:hypothetical protein
MRLMPNKSRINYFLVMTLMPSNGHNGHRGLVFPVLGLIRLSNGSKFLEVRRIIPSNGGTNLDSQKLE